MAIYNARLHKDSQDKLRMEEQPAVAREIQQAWKLQESATVLKNKFFFAKKRLHSNRKLGVETLMKSIGCHLGRVAPLQI
jgi:hypothetical protein